MVSSFAYHLLSSISLQSPSCTVYSCINAEAGHALVGALMPEYDPVAKISIIPRGQAGGLTFFAPSEERLESGLYSRSYLENQMAVALGRRLVSCNQWHSMLFIFNLTSIMSLFFSRLICLLILSGIILQS